MGGGAAAGSTLTADLTTPGQAQVALNLGSALGSGKTELVRLIANVPVNAPYGAKHVLGLKDIRLNGGSLPVRADDGLHVAAYLGDSSGNAQYSSLDLQRLQRVISNVDGGFTAYPMIDPILIGDTSGEGSLSSLDLQRLYKKIVGLVVPDIHSSLLLKLKLMGNTTGNGSLSSSVWQRLYNKIPELALPGIPDIPIGIGPLIFSGADPVLSLPIVSGKPGEVVTVPVNLDTAAGLESIELKLAYPAEQLEVLDVRLAGLTTAFPWFIKDTRTAGQISIDTSGLEALAGGSGRVLEIDFRVNPSAEGILNLDLQWAALNETHLTLNPVPQAGADPTDGAIRVNLPYHPDAIANARPNQAASPVIDFARRYEGFEFRAGDSKGWLGDWLGDSKTQSKKPNLDALRIQPKVAPRLSARV